MSFDFPLACALASLFLCGGCVAAAWLRIRRTVQAVERLRREIDLKLQEHDETYQRLEARVEDLAQRLARATSERRELSVQNQRFSADNRALAEGLRAAQEATRDPEPAFAQAVSRSEELESPYPGASVFVPEQETIVALVEEPAPEPASGSPDRIDEVSAQEEESVMGEWDFEDLRQSFTSPETPPPDVEAEAEPVPQASVEDQRAALPAEREPETAASARVRERVREIERQLAFRDDQWQQHDAAIESLRGTSLSHAGQLDAFARRCSELERQLALRDEQGQQREDALARRCSELERQLALRDEQGQQREDEVAQRCSELERLVQQIAERAAERPQPDPAAESANRAREAEFAALQAELAASRLRLDAVERRFAESEQASDVQAQEEREEHEGAIARASELEEKLADHGEELRQRDATIERLQADLVAKNRHIEAAGERNAELEQKIQRIALEEQARLHKEEELHHGWTSRASDLEGHLARRDEELRQRGAAIELLEGAVVAKDRQLEAAGERTAELEQRVGSLDAELERRSARIELLEGELVAKNAQIEAADERCAEIERRFQRQEERDQERIGREQDVQRALSARAAELEERTASLADELRQRSAALELLQQQAAAKDREVRGAGERCSELERELQRRAGEEQARQVQEQTLESARLLRIAELERELATRDEAAQRLRGEYAQLAERYQDLAQKLELRIRDLGAQEEQIAEIQARSEATELGAKRVQEEARASDALADELVENRLTTVFKRPAKGADPLSELYLDGLEQGDFEHAVQALIGDPEPLGAASVARLGNRWRGEHAGWRSTPLDREVVYLWADGVHLRAGLERPEDAVLVVVASHADGSRSVVACESGDPASKEAWLAVLRHLVARGMNVPRLVVAPGSSGLWTGIDELGWDSARQYCWSHETEDLLAGLPKKRRSQADKILRAASSAETRADAKKLRDRFVKRCGVRCADTGERLAVDWKQLTSFYAFPEDHWTHLKTTQVIEAPLASIQLHATEPKPGRPSPYVESVVWKLLSAAARSQKKLSAAGPAAAPGRETEGGPAPRPRRRRA